MTHKSEQKTAKRKRLILWGRVRSRTRTSEVSICEFENNIYLISSHSVRREFYNDIQPFWLGIHRSPFPNKITPLWNIECMILGSENLRFFPNKKSKKKKRLLVFFPFPRGGMGGKENAFANDKPPAHPEKETIIGEIRENSRCAVYRRPQCPISLRIILILPDPRTQ